MITKILSVYLAAATLVFGIQAHANSVIELTPKNTVTLRGPIDESMAGALISKVQEKAEGRLNIIGQPSPVYLFLDSPGGSIAAGLDIIANLKTIRNLKTVSLFAASMASGIVQALPGERLGTENSILMFHRAKGSVSGQFESGELETRLELWKSIVRKMELQNATRMNMTLKDYKDQVLNEMWIHGNDNLSRNSLDKITSFKCSRELIKQTEIVAIQTFFGVLKLKFSACPLLTYPLGIVGGKEAEDMYQKAYGEISKKFSFGYKI